MDRSTIGTGNYTVTMRPIKKEDYTLAVTLGGHHVAKSPYHVQVCRRGFSGGVGGRRTGPAPHARPCPTSLFRRATPTAAISRRAPAARTAVPWNLTGYISAPAPSSSR